MIVELTQFLTPDGRRKEVHTDIDDSLKEKVDIILSMGLIFTCELLAGSNQSAVYITDEKEETDISIEIATNGPGDKSPKNMLEKMIREFDPKMVMEQTE